MSQRFAEFLLQQLGADEDWLVTSVDAMHSGPDRDHLIAAVEHVRMAGQAIAKAYGIALRRPHVYLLEDAECFLCHATEGHGADADCPGIKERAGAAREVDPELVLLREGSPGSGRFA